MRPIFFTELYAGGIDVKDYKLDGRGVTCLSGFLRASTDEVGMPTNPAPKQATLYSYFC